MKSLIARLRPVRTASDNLLEAFDAVFGECWAAVLAETDDPETAFVIAFATSLPRGSFGRSVRIQAPRSSTNGRLSFWRTARRSSAHLTLMPRSISHSRSMRRTASNAKGEIGAGALSSALRRALASISASAKNGRRGGASRRLPGSAPADDRPDTAKSAIS